MSRYSYDLHIHSCLSPCADDDMTPANIAGMLSIAGIKLAAVTDHNTCRNCPAFFKACGQYGIVPVAGMELTTSEEIHLVCLFPDLEPALEFDSQVHGRMAAVKNKPGIFGNQIVMDENDNVLGTEELLLINAAGIGIAEASGMVRRLGGACYPAHIDRQSGGIIAILGGMPSEPRFNAVEFNDSGNAEKYIERYSLEDKIVLCSSDAHHLWDISDPVNFVDLDDEPYSSANVRHRLIEFIERM